MDEQALRASLVSIAPADPASAEVRWCFEQYFAELGRRFDAGFDPALSIPATADELIPPSGLVVLAHPAKTAGSPDPAKTAGSPLGSELGDEPVGCAAIKFHENAPAEIKRMWVAPWARGLGLGRRLLESLEQHARDAGVTVLHLETNRNLVEAIQLYRACGYRQVEAFNDEPYAHYWFEKRLSE